MENKDLLTSFREVIRTAVLATIDLVEEYGAEEAKDVIYDMLDTDCEDCDCEDCDDCEEEDDYEDDDDCDYDDEDEDEDDEVGSDALENEAEENLAVEIASDIEDGKYTIDLVEDAYPAHIVDRIKYLAE